VLRYLVNDWRGKKLNRLMMKLSEALNWNLRQGDQKKKNTKKNYNILKVEI